MTADSPAGLLARRVAEALGWPTIQPGEGAPPTACIRLHVGMIMEMNFGNVILDWYQDETDRMIIERAGDEPDGKDIATARRIDQLMDGMLTMAARNAGDTALLGWLGKREGEGPHD